MFVLEKVENIVGKGEVHTTDGCKIPLVCLY